MIRLAVILLVIVMLSPGLAAARSAGVTSADMAAGPATCSTSCHGGAAIGLVTIDILGPDTLTPGETAIYSFEMMELLQGGLQVGTGINVSMFLDGDQVLLDPQLENHPSFPTSLQVLNGEITHTSTVNALPSPDGGVGVFLKGSTVKNQNFPTYEGANGKGFIGQAGLVLMERPKEITEHRRAQIQRITEARENNSARRIVDDAAPGNEIRVDHRSTTTQGRHAAPRVAEE